MEIRSVLNKNGFVFKKKFGQNFLTDDKLLGRIADYADVKKDDVCVEIGCGAGTLTRVLSKRAGKVIGFEVDETLKPVLVETLSGCENTEIVFRDILSVDFKKFEEKIGQEYAVVANLPYYITTPVLLRFLEEGTRVKKMTLTLQKEVALRLVAKAGTSDYGAITVTLSAVADATLNEIVPRTAFLPSPNVDSAVVTLTFNREKYPSLDKKAFKAVIRAAFSSRRKTLTNNLMQSFSLSREKAEGVLSELGVAPSVRGETLTVDDFVRLSEIVSKKQGVSDAKNCDCE